jgi:hypothetical protein
MSFNEFVKRAEASPYTWEIFGRLNELVEIDKEDFHYSMAVALYEYNA